MPHSKTQIYNGDFRYLQQMYIFSCFRFELSFPIDTKQIAVQLEHARSSTSPTSNRCGSNGQREQTFPKASWLYRELGFLEYLDHDIRQTKKGKVYTNPFHRTTARRKGRDHSLETEEPVQLPGLHDNCTLSWSRDRMLTLLFLLHQMNCNKTWASTFFMTNCN